jgi:hypothetical protein
LQRKKFAFLNQRVAISEGLQQTLRGCEWRRKRIPGLEMEVTILKETENLRQREVRNVRRPTKVKIEGWRIQFNSTAEQTEVKGTYRNTLN